MAAALIAAGWSLSRATTPPATPDPAEIDEIPTGSSVRLTLRDRLVVGPLYGYDSRRKVLRVGGSGWLLDRVLGLSCVRQDDAPAGVYHYPAAGSLLAQSVGAEVQPAFWASVRIDAALVGVLARIDEELSIGISTDGATPDLLRDLVMPAEASALVAGTRLFSGVGATELELDSAIGLVLLDGVRGMAWLDELWECPLIVAVIDRTQPDEVLVDAFLQHRATGRALPIAQLGWDTGDSIQALAYEVPR
jgi:hypothetical protein